MIDEVWVRPHEDVLHFTLIFMDATNGWRLQ